MPRSNKNQGDQSGRSILKKSVSVNLEPSIDKENLKQRMEACGIPSITALAERAEIARGTVYNFINGESGKKDTIDRIVKALDTCEAELRRHPTLKVKRELAFELVMPDKWKQVYRGFDLKVPRPSLSLPTTLGNGCPSNLEQVEAVIYGHLKHTTSSSNSRQFARQF